LINLSYWENLLQELQYISDS